MKVGLEKETKKSKRSIWIGIIMIVVGAIFIFVAVKGIIAHNNSVKTIQEEYQQEYDEWQNNWWNHDADLSDMPERPDTGQPIGQVFLIIGSSVVVLMGLAMVFSGATSTSFFKTVDEQGDVLSTLNEDASESTVNTTNKTIRKRKTKCENCGATITDDTCDYCGQ